MVAISVSGKIVGRLNQTLLSANPMVFAEQGGTIIKSTVPDGTGNFILSPLEQSSTVGNYDVLITADNHAGAMIQSVPVTAQATSTISDNTNPINLINSSTHLITGTVHPVSAEGFIRAIRTFSSGPIMEIGFITANSTDGSYSLPLPIGAPSLGSYGSLPILLTVDPYIAGEYQVEASATSYVTQNLFVDMGAGDVTANFTLIAAP